MKKLIYAFLALNLFIVLFFWWKNSGGGSVYLALGRLSGLLAVLSILFQFLLMGRAAWLEKTFGLDKLSKYHHLNGYLSSVFILLHPILITIGYAQITKVNFTSQFLDLINNFEDVNKALIGAILFLSIIFISIYIVRNRIKYEAWYFVHIFVYLAVVFAWGHQLRVGEDFLGQPIFAYYWYLLYAFVFGNLLIFRILKPIYEFYTHEFYVDRVVKENEGVVSIYITGKDMESFHVNPGQFMKFNFLTPKFWYQSHPFSLSKVANGKIRITPKNSGDFTSELPSLKPGTKVIIDGPYGTFTSKRIKKDKVLFIAGGIGITPIRSLIEELAGSKNIILLYSAKTENEIVFKKELGSLSNKYKFPIHYIVTQKVGHLNKEKIEKLVKNVEDYEVMMCGPVPMMDAVTKDLIALGVPNSNIHFEKFSL
ncbi:MAG TPA: ferredoxin reductase family protein [Patescibacteria group bacterium]